MAQSDLLSKLISTPLDPLKPEWQVQTQIEAATQARQLDKESPDKYWEWVATQLRWMEPWQTVRDGDFPDVRYFSGGKLNVADNCVDRWAENPLTADTPAVIWEGEPGDEQQLSYAELKEEVSRCANALKSLGIQKGDVVALYMQNLIEAFVVIHACNRIGAVYTVLFAGFSADAIVTRLEVAQPKAVVVANKSYRRGREVDLLSTWREARAKGAAADVAIIINRTREEYPLREGEVDYHNLLAQQSIDCPCEALEANDPSFLVFTSGTESKPKGLIHSVAGFLMGAWTNAFWQLGAVPLQNCWCATDVGWLTFPIQAVIGGLAAGSTQVCYEGSIDFPAPDRFYQIAEKYKITKLITAPTVIRMLRACEGSLPEKYPLPDLELVSLQGEALDATSYHWLRNQFAGGVPVVNAYGQTETGSTWTFPIYGVDDTKAGSCAKPVPGFRFDILDSDGQPVAPGVRGNLVLTQPWPSLARTILHNHPRYVDTYFSRFPGCYWCADEAVLDHDGHIWVLGRADDVINVAGHRLSTMEIESAVTAHPAVIEGAVMGIEHDVKGLVPMAYVCIKEGSDDQQVTQELKQRVQEAIGGIARLEAVYVTRIMPKTRAGKIMRRLLREIILTGEVTADTSGLEDTSAIAACCEAKKY